jgi:hypothetical protein
MALAGQLELRFPVRVEDIEPLVLTGDISEDDILKPARLSVAMSELLPDMARYYASRLDELQREPATLYRLEPWSAACLRSISNGQPAMARRGPDARRLYIVRVGSRVTDMGRVV